MKILEIVVSRSVKVNLGDYQSTDFFVSAKVETPDGKTGNARKQAVLTLEKGIADDIHAHFKRRGKKASLSDIRKRYGLAVREV